MLTAGGPSALNRATDDGRPALKRARGEIVTALATSGDVGNVTTPSLVGTRASSARATQSSVQKTRVRIVYGYFSSSYWSFDTVGYG